MRDLVLAGTSVTVAGIGLLLRRHWFISLTMHFKHIREVDLKSSVACMEAHAADTCKHIKIVATIYKVRSIRLHHRNQFTRCCTFPFVSAVQQWRPLNHAIRFKRCRSGAALVHDFPAPSMLTVPAWCSLARAH